jgi:hypothetical protein
MFISLVAAMYCLQRCTEVTASLDDKKIAISFRPKESFTVAKNKITGYLSTRLII